MTYRCLLVCAALIAAAGCHTKGPQFDPSARQSAASPAFTAVTLTNTLNPAWLRPPRDLYRLGPGDAIIVDTLGETATANSYTIGPDGKIYYSLLPGLSVWGLSLSETQALLEQEMARYTKAKPNLVVNLRTVGSQRVWILGGGNANSVYTLNTPTTLLEAISSVGGAGLTGPATAGTPAAVRRRGAASASPAAGELATDDLTDLQRSFVLRDGHRVPVDFERLLKMGDLSQNIYLQPDDFVYMPSASQASIYVLGAVSGPSAIPYARDLTVSAAIITAGGTAKYAFQTRVAIIRGALSHPQIAQVDYGAIVTGRARDVLLQPGDIVYVPYIPGRQILELADEMLDQFVRTIAINQASYTVSGQENAVGVSVAPGTVSGGIFVPPGTQGTQ